jgi:hypothetical protein
MSWTFAAWLLLGGSTVLLFIGMPVALTFLAVNLVGAWLYMGGEVGLVQLARSSVSSVAAFALTPIPLFVLMGEVLFHTGLAHKVIEGIDRLITRVPGRLAVVAVVAGTVFSAISGSTIATTAMLGSLMLPVMLARGYHPTLATGPIMAIGAVDMLIPPSALTVLLGSLSGISISKLLLGGIVPGLILSLAFIAWIILRVRLSPALAPQEAQAVRYTGWDRWHLLVAYVLPTMSIFGVVVGALSAGWATPTECAALGAFATMVLAALYRRLSWQGRRGRHLRHDSLHHPGRHHLCAAAVVFRGEQRAGATDHRPGVVQRDDCGGHDGLLDLSGPVRRSGQHDDDHAAHLHAHRQQPGDRPDLVWRDVSHVHADGPVAAAARAAADDHARRGTARGAHLADLPGRHTVCADEPAAAGGHLLLASHCHLAAQRPIEVAAQGSHRVLSLRGATFSREEPPSTTRRLRCGNHRNDTAGRNDVPLASLRGVQRRGDPCLRATASGLLRSSQ